MQSCQLRGANAGIRPAKGGVRTLLTENRTGDTLVAAASTACRGRVGRVVPALRSEKRRCDGVYRMRRSGMGSNRRGQELRMFASDGRGRAWWASALLTASAAIGCSRSGSAASDPSGDVRDSVMPPPIGGASLNPALAGGQAECIIGTLGIAVAH